MVNITVTYLFPKKFRLEGSVSSKTTPKNGGNATKYQTQGFLTQSKTSSRH